MSGPLDLQGRVHRRFNPLTGEWVLVSPHRTGRPWQGQAESAPDVDVAQHDPSCFLCPGNVRAGGQVNPPYQGTFVFDNDFAALVADAGVASYSDGGLLEARSESGICRVLCYSPRHDQGLGRLPPAAIRAVIDTWAAETVELGRRPRIAAVTIFENRGAQMGASNPHPHGQIWATETVPLELAKESRSQERHWMLQERCLLCDYVALELAASERLVCANEEFIAVVPFWAVWPFETLVLPRRHVGSLDRLDEGTRTGFAAILAELTRRYDALFATPFPFTMGIHQAPTDGAAHPYWHLHAHFFPPLLRSATVRKFMVGFELLAGPQRDITAETAAARLRAAG